MKTLLFAAALVIAAPAVAQAQVAAGALPNTFDGPAPARATPAAAPATPAPATPAAGVAATPANAASEPTLRALIAGIQAGTLDYALMTDDLAGKVREQEATVTSLIQDFGALQSLTFAGAQGGADLFAVSFAEVETQWVIGFNEAGKVAVLLFRPAQ